MVSGEELEAIRKHVIAKYGFQTKITKLLGTIWGVLRGKRIPYGDRGVIVTPAPRRRGLEQTHKDLRRASRERVSLDGGRSPSAGRLLMRSAVGLLAADVGARHSSPAESGDDPDQHPHPEETTEPIDPARRLLQRPHGEAEDEDHAADVVCAASGQSGEAPPRQRDEERGVGELRDGEAAWPADLAAPPKLSDGHRVMLARR